MDRKAVTKGVLEFCQSWLVKKKAKIFQIVADCIIAFFEANDASLEGFMDGVDTSLTAWSFNKDQSP